MPIVIVIVALALAAAAVWFLTRPLRMSGQDDERQESQRQLAPVRERLLAQLNELDQDAADHAMDTSIVADERARLEAELAQVLKQLDEIPSARAPLDTAKGRWAAPVVIALALPLLAVGLYTAKHHTTLARLNDPGVVEDAVPPMVREMVARLERRLRENPGDPEGWARLGRAYDVLNRRDEAKQAYARAYELAPNNADVLAAYAGMLMAENPANPSLDVVNLFKRLHRLDPKHPGALWVLGLVAFHDTKYRDAIRYWDALAKQLPPESEALPEIRHALAIARERAGQKK